MQITLCWLTPPHYDRIDNLNKHIENKRMKKALIVGNGGSSVNPNAKGLSNNKDVFRVNRFFLEPNLLFGKKIKFLNFSGQPYEIFLIDYLIRKKIYNIEIASYRELPVRRFFIPHTDNLMIPWSKIAKKYNLDKSVKGFDGPNRMNSIKKHDKITTGPYLINLAIQMGYKNISIIGIDFYSEKSNKKYPIVMPKCLKKIIIFGEPFISVRMSKLKGNAYNQGHNINVDLDYVQALVNNNKNVEFNVYIDDDNTYKNWTKIIGNNSKNINIHMLKHYNSDNLMTHCLADIKTSINEYKNKYFWKDKIVNAKHLFSNKREVIKKITLLFREWILEKIK